MDPAPPNAPDNGRPVFYAGRFVDRVPPAALPGGGVLLGDWDVLPASLASALDGASALVVADPLSFPFEALIGVQKNVPVVLVIPPDLDADAAFAVFGEPALARLGPFDRVATPDDALWESLRRRYGLSADGRLAIRDADPGAAVGEIAALLDGAPSANGSRGPAESETGPEGRYARRRRGGGLVSAHEKAVHRTQRAVMEPQFAAARGPRAEDAPFDVLEVGAGRGRWLQSFDRERTRFFGVDPDEENVAAARAGFPEAGFDPLGEDLRLPHEDETFDLVFSVTTLQRHPAPEKERLLSEMWRVAKPGGRLLFLEDFVFEGGVGGPGIHPVSVRGFVGLLLGATDGQVVLEHVESLRYPGENLTRGGLLAVSRLGVPKRW